MVIGWFHIARFVFSRYTLFQIDSSTGRQNMTSLFFKDKIVPLSAQKLIILFFKRLNDAWWCFYFDVWMTTDSCNSVMEVLSESVVAYFHLWTTTMERLLCSVLKKIKKDVPWWWRWGSPHLQRPWPVPTIRLGLEANSDMSCYVCVAQVILQCTFKVFSIE